MNLHRKTYTTQVQGHDLQIEISDLALQANAAIIGKFGGTSVIATVVVGKDDKDLDFLPLTVDYEERYYAAGKIIGSRFIRREGRPSDEAILSARLLDHAIRPLFDQNIRRDVHVTVTVLSYDEKYDPDILALLTVSIALSISEVPWAGPVSGIKFRSEPDSRPEYEAFFSGTGNLLNMMELEASELGDDEILKLHDNALTVIQALNSFQDSVIKAHAKPKLSFKEQVSDPELEKIIRILIESDLETAIKDKKIVELEKRVKETVAALPDITPERKTAAKNFFKKAVEDYVLDMILVRGLRPDGRALNEVRDLYSEVGLFERIHGSGLFIRGTTQVLALTTLGAPSAEQLVETMETTAKKGFLLHYNFPSYSVGEVGRPRGPGRREIGHGTLAAKALRYLLPARDKFPYTVRVVAETLSSNGSSSMASTCAASLSLMDAGVPLKCHAAGIAIGLALNESTGKYCILTDIQGPEDHYCDMDFKVAGTRKGVTAIQLDMKVRGITREIIKDALSAAQKARLHILDVMESVLKEPRKEISPYAPKVLTLSINPEKIGMVIGSGGRTINGILAAANNEITIDIEPTGMIYIAGVSHERVQKAYDVVESIVHEYKVGEMVQGTVVKLLEFGAIVEFAGGRDGMIHVSEMKEGFVKKAEDVLKLGESVHARVVRVDEDGRIGLSLKLNGK